MYLPKINKRSIRKKQIDSFEGINRGRVTQENEFYNTCNLSSRFYPALASVSRRYELDCYEHRMTGDPLFFRNGDIYHIVPYYPENGHTYSLFKGDVRLLDFDFSGTASAGNIVNFNSKTLFVNKNTAYEFDPRAATPLAGFLPMGYTLTVQPAQEEPGYNKPTLRLSLVYEDMSDIGNFISSTQDSEFPDDAEVGDMFAKNLEYYRLIHKDGTGTGEDIWQPVTSLRLRLNIGDGYRNFTEGDYVQLKDLKYWNWRLRSLGDLDRFVRIDSIDGEGRYITESITVFKDMNNILEKRLFPTNDIGYGSPIIDNTGNDLYLLSGSVSACMPSMDLICTGANRVWGCSNDNREIYASELGNGRNFSVFEGLSGDSYAVSVGSEGEFTACCNYLGAPVFFKESEMIVVTGSRPASFTLNSYSVKGVPRHSPDGLCVTDDILYYISSDGIYAYNGSSSVCISRNLGEDIGNIRSCVLCGEAGVLYVSGMTDGKPVQYTYDIKRRIWHTASSERITGYIKYPDAALAVCFDGAKASLVTLDGGIPCDYPLTGALEKDTDWCWETGDISYSVNKKYLRKLSLDTSCEGESKLYISYDGGEFQRIGSFAPHNRGSVRISVFPRRCDYFRLKMEGSSDTVLYAIVKETEEVAENG